MDYTSHLPPRPDKVEVGQVWREIVKHSRYDELTLDVIWLVLSEVSIMRLGGSYGHPTPAGGALVFEVPTKSEVWQLLSLPRIEFKPGQLWYNRATMKLFRAESKRGTFYLSGDWHLIEDAPSDANLNLSETKNKGENKMFTQTHRVSDVVLKQIDRETIADSAQELAQLFGYVSVTHDDRLTPRFRIPGKLVGGIDVTPEEVEKLFRDRIVGNSDLTVLNAACGFGIVERVVFEEIKEGDRR